MKRAAKIAIAIGATITGSAAIAIAAAAVARPNMVDLTMESDSTIRKPRNKDISGIAIHQTSVQSPTNKNRFRKYKYHYIVDTDGTIYKIHPEEFYIPSTDNVNHWTISIGIAGNFDSVRGKYFKPEKFGKSELTPAQIKSALFLLADIRRRYGALTMLAHRQTAPGDMRGNDPGPDIWSRIVRPARRFGLKTAENQSWGPGLEIPNDWA